MQEWAAADPGEQGGLRGSPCPKFLTFPISSETETGFKSCSAADCREALGRGLPHSVSFLQFEVILGRSSGGRTEELGKENLSLSHPDTSLLPLPTCSLPLDL